MKPIATRILLALLMASSISLAQSYPTADFPISYAPDAPGLLDCSNLLAKNKPAGQPGPITIRDGHFFSGQNRIRFWGVNIAFGGNFPTHEQAANWGRRVVSVTIVR